MQPLESLIVDATFRSRVQAAVERLGRAHATGVCVVAAPRWRAFADRLMLEECDAVDAEVPLSVLVVGPPAVVLSHAARAERSFAFVMPVAQISKPWQRARTWRDDATIDLWRAGWTPVAVDRMLVAGDDATGEFVIGTARHTPAVAGADD